MRDERRPFTVLYRHFLGAFLDNDLVAPASDLHGPLSKAAAALAVLGLLYPFKLLGTYGRPFQDYAVLDALSWADKCTFVTLSLVVTGLLTVVEWDALRLDRRDCRALGVLPIGSATILSAKLAAVGTFVLALSIPLALVGALIFPAVMHAGWRSAVGLAAATLGGHVVATLAAAWFACFAVLAAQGLLACLPAGRLARRLESAVQVTTTLAFVAALLMLPFIASSTAALKQASDGAGGLAPQMWFMGIYQSVAGLGDPAWAHLADRGWLALALAFVVAIGASLQANRRALGRLLVEPAAPTRRRSILVRGGALAARLVARHPSERGFFAFTLITMLRSPWHRVALAMALGVALALAVVTMQASTMGWQAAGRAPLGESLVLATQWLVVVIVLAGVRIAAATPTELRANWVLQLLESDRPDRWMAGFRKAVLSGLIAPVLIVLAGATAIPFGWRAAVVHGLTALVFAAATFEVLFRDFGRVPFACPVERGSGEFRVRGPVAVAIFTIALVPIADLVTAAGRSGRGAAAVLAAGAGTTALLRLRGRRILARRGGLAFEPDDASTQALGIQP